MMLYENIREIRKRRGMTQEALAEAMGVSTASVSKWETGQSAPELTALTALADFFEVSVDALLGHEVKADRRQGMLDTMKALAEDGEFEDAKAVAQKLLQTYPNTYAVVDSVASLYYRIFVTTREKAAMERSIELVRRLFPLAEGGEKVRIALLSRLANHYELLGDWDMARKYYEEGNVDASNDRHLAYLLAREKGGEVAIRQISGVFSQNLFGMFTDVMMLNELWTKLGQPEKAQAAINWAITALGGCGAETEQAFAPMGAVLHLAGLVHGDEENHIRRAAQFIKGSMHSDVPAFLVGKQHDLMASQELLDGEGLKAILCQMNMERFVPIVDEVLG